MQCRESLTTNFSTAFLNRCTAFFCDKTGQHFVAVRWYKEVGAEPLHPVVKLAQLELAPANMIDSYDILPMECVANGALIIKKGNYYWALQSPRETVRYEALNTDTHA